MMARIEAIALYELVGKRQSLIAPNAYAGIRPAEARENLLLLLSDDGLYGITNYSHRWRDGVQPEIGWVIGLNPRELFIWKGGQVVGRAPAYTEHLKTAAPLDVAFLDLCAQQEGVPLWKLMGDPVRARIPAYDSTLYFEDLIDTDSSVENVVARAHQALERGHRTLKIKVGRGLKWMPWPDCTERDVEVCKAIRQAVGPDIALMVDANKGYAGYIEDAVDFLMETASCNFVFAEELVEDDDLLVLREAMRAQGITIPLAGGENATSRAWCDQFWADCPYDILQMDICRTGLMEYLEIAEFARDHNIKLAPHNFGSQLGIYESLQLGAVVPEYLYCECDDSEFDGYEASGYTLQDGSYALPDKPGLGLTTLDPRNSPLMEM
jgi:D-galactarolactone cycloisomerase